VPRPALSVILPVHGVSPAEVLAAARAAESGGLHGLWVPDHLTNTTRPRAGVLECWTLLAWLAGRTERATLGPLVLSTPLRSPTVLAKAAATLAVLAPGRLRLGLGSGGMTYGRVCREFGIAELTPRERVQHCRETLQLLRRSLEESEVDFRGIHARAEKLQVWPRPDRCPPLVLAARRPGMLALAAELADEWNCPLPHELAAGLDALERSGRARDSIRVSVFSILVLGRNRDEAARMLEAAGPAAQWFGDVATHHLFGGPEEVAAGIRRLARAGADEVTLDVRGAPVDQVRARLVEQVVPLLDD
jgi:alkanesulfonate monooxygenase SsuD/methylene tetrahydromethanopterin reductase-like flavin-dependent oxidoreductase (luciferase family)